MTPLGRRRFLGFTISGIGALACRSAPIERQKPAPSAVARPREPAVHDAIVRGGLVLDGRGNAALRADVGIRAGRISAVGDLSGDRSEIEIDAREQHVCPGFIDLHSHADETCFAYPAVESVVRQGVTTVLVGQDGFSLSPESAAASTKKNAELGVSEDWSTFAGYQTALERHPPAVNVASMVGQGTLRRQVMGERPGPATARELDAMRALASEALAAGAFGISSGLEYPPSANAARAELGELCRVLGPMHGLYMTHLRNEDDALLEAIEEAIAIARASGARLHVSHLKASGRRNWPKLTRALELLEGARDVSATADCYPYEAYFTTLQNLFPPAARAQGVKPFLAALRDPERSGPLRAAAEAKAAMLGSWDAVMLSELRGTARRAWDGRRVGELALSLQRAPIDVVVDLLIELEGRVGMLGFGMSEENLTRTIAHELVAVASDGGALATTGPLAGRKAHPRSYGTFPRVLARLVRDKSAIGLPQAIAKMTSLPARILGLRDRGWLAVGAAADIVVFDPKVVEDRATYDAPHQYPVGISRVLVNGQLVIDGGRHTGVRAGRALRRV